MLLPRGIELHEVWGHLDTELKRHQDNLSELIVELMRQNRDLRQLNNELKKKLKGCQ